MAAIPTVKKLKSKFNRLKKIQCLGWHDIFCKLIFQGIMLVGQEIKIFGDINNQGNGSFLEPGSVRALNNWAWTS